MRNIIKEYAEIRARKAADIHVEVKCPHSNFVIEHLSEDHRKFIILQENDFLPENK